MASPVCHWVRSVLSAHLDGELKSSTAQAVRRHLKRCPACRDHLRQLEETWRLLDAADAPPLRPGFTGRMMKRIVEEKALEQMEARLRPQRIRRRALRAVTGLAAGLAIGFALYGWTGRLHEPNSPVEREVCRHVGFLEDADLLDKIAVIQAIDQWTHAPGTTNGT